MSQALNGVLICIFSYNRGHYLANLLQSIEQFYPGTDWHVWDDHSTAPATVALLQSLGDQVTYAEAPTGAGKHGGLYRNMEAALTYAAGKGYRYVYFVQDDMQFVRNNPLLPEQCTRLFAQPKVLMVNTCFLARIAFYMAEKTVLPQYPEAHLHRDFGVADTGLIDVAKAMKAGLNFDKGSERANGEYWQARGYQLVVLHQPDLCWVPWPEVYRHRARQWSWQLRTTVRSLLVKPLTPKAEARLAANSSIAYLEDYTSAAHPFMIKPYWYQDFVSAKAMVSVYCKYYMHRLRRLFVKPRMA
jgi:hypothetical protein